MTTDFKSSQFGEEAMMLDPMTRHTLALAEALKRDDAVFQGQPINQAAHDEIMRLHDELMESQDSINQASATLMSDGTVLELATQRHQELEALVSSLRQERDEALIKLQQAGLLTVH